MVMAVDFHTSLEDQSQLVLYPHIDLLACSVRSSQPLPADQRHISRGKRAASSHRISRAPGFVAMAAVVVQERDVRGALFKESGGGTLYCALPPFTHHLYKEVKSEEEMEQLWSMRGKWAALRGTDWTYPAAWVANDDGTIIGYVMDRVPGSSVWEASRSATWTFPLRTVVARVTACMAQAMEVGIYPLIEHGGNVVVNTLTGGSQPQVRVIDVDGCVEWTASHSPLTMLKQLETIFLNFERHPFYRAIFDISSGDPVLWPELQSASDVLAVCSAGHRVQPGPVVQEAATSRRGRSRTRGPPARPSQSVASVERAESGVESQGLGQPVAAIPPSLPRVTAAHVASASVDDNAQQPTPPIQRVDFPNGSDIAGFAPKEETSMSVQPSDAQALGCGRGNGVPGISSTGDVMHVDSSQGSDDGPQEICSEPPTIFESDSGKDSERVGERESSSPAPPRFRRGDIEELWEPDDVADLILEGERFDFRPEVITATHSLAAEINELRDTVNGLMAHWPVPLEVQDVHAIYAVALCAHMGTPWDARSDLLCARLLALLQGEDMRAHEEAVYMYTRGHYEALSEIPGYKVVAMEKALARAPAYFFHMMEANAPRDLTNALAILRQFRHTPQLALSKSRFISFMRETRKGRGKAQGKASEAPGVQLSPNARWWGEAALELFPLGIKFTRKTDTAYILEVYHAWFRTERPAEQYILDCNDVSVKVKLVDRKLKLVQVPKSRDNNCYIHIPVTLGNKPSDDDLARLRRVLCTGYAGQPYERNAVTAMECLALAGRPMPQLCVVMRGRGRNTKSGLSKLRAAVMGSGHKFVPASVLHVPEEMRKQLLHFSQARCITIKECKGRVWLEEDVTKNLFGRDELDARLLFGRETKMFALDTCAIFWEMNMVPPRIMGDPTNVDSLESWWRRFLICDFESSFTSSAEKVAPEDRIFQNDYTLAPFLKSGSAALTYLRYFVLPFMERHTEEDCVRILEEPPESVLQKSKDFVVWMASDQLPTREEATGSVGGEADVAGGAAATPRKSAGQTMVEAVHKHYAHERFIRIAELERNRGLPGAARSSKFGKKTRADHLREACRDYPYLLRYQASRPMGFLRLNIDLEKFDVLMAMHGSDKFGTFESWGVVFELRDALLSKHFSATEITDVGPEEAAAPEDPADRTICTLTETVNLSRLESVALAEARARETEAASVDGAALRMLQAYIARCRAEGRCYGMYCDLDVQYYVKFGLPSRRYPRGPSLAKLSKRYKAVACDALCFSVDQKNAFPNIAWAMAQDLVPNVEDRLTTWPLYQKHYKEWRSFMAEYASIAPRDAKKCITKMFGLGLPDYDVPFLWAMAMDIAIFKDALQRSPQYASLATMFGERNNPEATRFFYALSPEEDSRTQQAVSMFEQNSFASVSALIFDGAIMTSGANRRDLQERCEACERILGFQITLEFFDGPYCIARQLLATGLGHAAGALVPQAGNQRCLFDSVSFLRPSVGDIVAPSDGPFTVATFNVMMRDIHEGGSDAVCLVHVPEDGARATLSGPREEKRRRVGAEQQLNGFVGWQPYGGAGHFFSVRCERGGEVTVLDSHVGVAVQAPVDDFVQAWQQLGHKPLPFFAVHTMTLELPDMQDPVYHLAGGAISSGEESGSASGESACDDEDTPSADLAVPDTMLQLVAKEKADFFGRVNRRQAYGEHTGRNFACELCPMRAFQSRKRLAQHESEHIKPHCCISGKQFKAMKALFMERCAAQASDVLLARSPAGEWRVELLKASADQVRSMLQECPSYHKIGTALRHLDSVVAWAVTTGGMRLIIKSDALAMGFSRSGNMYYTDDFMRLLLSLCIDPRVKCSTKRVLGRLMTYFSNTSVPVPFMLPHRLTIHRLLVECLEQHGYIVTRGRERLQERQAFRAVTVDCAFKFMMTVKGQPKHGAPRREWQGDQGLHAVATARSQDGCMFAAIPLPAEHPPTIVADLAAIPGVFQQLEILGADRPRDWDTVAVFAALPSLQCVMGDPMHLVFAASSCYGSSKSPGVVKSLRKLAEKWCALGEANWLMRPFYRRLSGRDRPLTPREAMCVEAPRMTTQQASRHLEQLHERTPYSSRYQYIKAIVALKIAYSSELGRKTSDGETTLGDVLNRAIEWSNIEYYANGARWRNQHGVARRDMANGTVGNESEHADMKAWATNVFQQTRDRAVVVLKAWEMSKIVRHEAATYSPFPSTWGASGGEWLSRVLAKALAPVCCLRSVPPTKRMGNGNWRALRAPSIVRPPASAMQERPSLKRPASATRRAGFEGVRSRKVRQIQFKQA